MTGDEFAVAVDDLRLDEGAFGVSAETLRRWRASGPTELAARYVGLLLRDEAAPIPEREVDFADPDELIPGQKFRRGSLVKTEEMGRCAVVRVDRCATKNGVSFTYWCQRLGMRPKKDGKGQEPGLVGTVQRFPEKMLEPVDDPRRVVGIGATAHRTHMDGTPL